MPSVFVSHSSKDKPIVLRLAEDLKAHGHEVWLDVWKLKVGDCIVSGVEKGVAECEFVVLVLSAHAVRSNWVEREWKTKYWDEIEQGRVRVLPVLIEDCKRPELIKTKKYADLSASYDSGLAELLDALTQNPEPIAAAAKFPGAQSASSLVARAQQPGEPLAPCIAEALAFANAAGDADFASWCERELTGWRGVKEGDPGYPSYRIVDVVASAVELNPHFVGWGDDMSSGPDYLVSSGDGVRVRMLLPEPISEIERWATTSNQRALLRFSGPISDFVPNAGTNETVHLYGRGDAMLGIIDGVRMALTSFLVPHTRQRLHAKPNVVPTGG